MGTSLNETVPHPDRLRLRSHAIAGSGRRQMRVASAARRLPVHEPRPEPVEDGETGEWRDVASADPISIFAPVSGGAAVSAYFYIIVIFILVGALKGYLGNWNHPVRRDFTTDH